MDALVVDALIIGCGYLGQRVARLWRGQGKSVAATTRKAQPPSAFSELGLQPIVGDGLKPESLSMLPRAKTVLYAVGLDRTSGTAMAAVYVDGLANVLDAMPKPERFLYVSSTSVYGQADGRWVDENAAT